MASFHIVHIQRKHFHPISFPTNQSKIKPNIEKGSHDKSARTPNRKGQNDRFTVKNRNLDATWSCRTCPSDGSPLALSHFPGFIAFRAARARPARESSAKLVVDFWITARHCRRGPARTGLVKVVERASDIPGRCGSNVWISMIR